MPRADGETREPSRAALRRGGRGEVKPGDAAAGPGPGPGASLLLETIVAPGVRCAPAPAWLGREVKGVWLPTRSTAFPSRRKRRRRIQGGARRRRWGRGACVPVPGEGTGSGPAGEPPCRRSTPRGTRPRPRRGTCPTSWKGFSAKGGGRSRAPLVGRRERKACSGRAPARSGGQRVVTRGDACPRRRPPRGWWARARVDRVRGRARCLVLRARERS